MTCRTDACQQGRCKCPTPDECADYPYAWIDDLAGAARWLAIALLLLFVLAMSAGAIVNHWPQIVAALS